MFVLAHLSDPHLGPLPRPRLAELAGKRAAGFFNWRRKRHRIHRAEVLARVTADLKAHTADHIAVTGDLVNISLAGEYAPGRFGRDQIEKLAEVLERCGRERLFRVGMIHHPPISTRARHLKRLVDGADFRAALARHGAELVIHGHDHVHSLIELEGPQRRIPVIGAPSASAAAPVPPGERDCAGYNLYRSEGGSGGWCCEVSWRSLAREGNGIVEIKR